MISRNWSRCLLLPGSSRLTCPSATVDPPGVLPSPYDPVRSFATSGLGTDHGAHPTFRLSRSRALRLPSLDRAPRRRPASHSVADTQDPPPHRATPPVTLHPQARSQLTDRSALPPVTTYAMLAEQPFNAPQAHAEHGRYLPGGSPRPVQVDHGL